MTRKRHISHESSSSSSSSITDLHESLIINILIFLPLKFIIRCSCVCKNWSTIITQLPYFIESYHSSSDQRASSEPAQFLMQDKSNYKSPNNLFLVQLDDVYINPPPPKPIMPPKTQLLNILDDAKESCVKVCTTCCLTGFIGAYRWIKNDSSPKTYHIFNPVTGQHFVIDHIDTDGSIIRWEQSALVFAPKANQLKLISYFGHRWEQEQVKIQTIGTNLWKSIGTFPNNLNDYSFPVFVNGLYHWIDRWKHVIYSFDSDKEVFKLIDDEPPPQIRNRKFFYSNLGVLNGCLCICMKSVISIELWVLINESWTKKFVISDSKLGIDYHSRIHPLKCLENGEIVILCRPYHAICYDPSTTNYRIIELAITKPYWHECFPFVPSLRRVLPA